MSYDEGALALTPTDQGQASGAPVQMKTEGEPATTPPEADAPSAPESSTGPGEAGGDDTVAIIKAALAGYEGNAKEGSCNVSTESLGAKIFHASGGKLRPDRVFNGAHYVVRVGDILVDPTPAQFVNLPEGMSPPVFIGTRGEIDAQLESLVGQYGLRHESRAGAGMPHVPETITDAGGLSAWIYNGGSVMSYGAALKMRPSGKAADYDRETNTKMLKDAAANSSDEDADAALGLLLPTAKPTATTGARADESVLDAEPGGPDLKAPNYRTPDPLKADPGGPELRAPDHRTGTLEAAIADKLGAARASANVTERELADLDEEMKTASPWRKQSMEKQKAELDKRLAAERARVGTLAGDLETARDAGADPGKLAPLYVQYDPGASHTDAVATGPVATTLKRASSSTTAAVDDGDATVTTEDSSREVALDTGYTAVDKTSTTRTRATPGGPDKPSGVEQVTDEHSDTTNVGWKGATHTTASSTKRSTENGTTTDASSTSVNVGLTGTTGTRTKSREHADGSKDANEEIITSKPGELGYTSKDTRTDADGKQTEKKGTVTGKFVDDENGKGIGADGSYSVEQKKPAKPNPDGTSGGASRTLGATGTCGGKVQVKVVSMPATDKDPEPKAKVITTINFGVSLGGDAKGEKGSASVGINASASGNVTATFTDIILEKDATGFVDRVRAGANGQGLIGRAANIVGIATAADWMTAAKMFMNTEHNSAQGVKELPPGAGMSYEVAGEVEGGVTAGVDSGGFGANVAAGKKFGTSFKYNVVKLPGGKARITVIIKDTDDTSVGGGVSAGVVSLDVKHTEKDGQSSSIQFELDTGEGSNFDALFEQLKACRTTTALNAFAASNKTLVKARSHADSKGSEDQAKLAVGGKQGLNVTASSGSGVETESSIDEDGNLVLSKTGHNKTGLEVGVGALDLTYKESETEQAQVTKVDDQAALDVNQTDQSSDMTGQIANRVDKKLGGSGTEYKEQDVNVSGMTLTQKDLTGLIGLACSDDSSAWGDHTGNGELYAQWMRVRDDIRARFHGKEPKPDQDAQEVANILAEFVGKKEGVDLNLGPLGKHNIGGAVAGRDDIIYATVRQGTADGGRRYEFPDELASLKDEYTALAVGNPLKGLTAKLNGREPTYVPEPDEIEADTKFATDIWTRCRSLSQSLNSAGAKNERFKHGGDLPEMLAAIARREGEANVLIARISGGGTDDQVAMMASKGRYNAAVEGCFASRDQAEPIFAKMADNIDGDTQLSTGQGEDHRKLLVQLQGVYVQWRKHHGAMLNERADFGIGNPQVIADLKPDDGRYQAAMNYQNPNTPALLMAAVADRADAQARMERNPVPRGPKKKEAAAPAYDPAKLKKENEALFKSDANNTRNALPQAKNMANGARMRLQAWIHDHFVPGAQEAWDEAEEIVAGAKREEARLGKDTSDGMMQGFGLSALNEYQRAAQSYQKGLALYPKGNGGWPAPK